VVWNWGSIVGLDDFDLERQALDDVVEEVIGGSLVQSRRDAQDAEPCAIVDDGKSEELVPPAAASRGR